MPRDPLFPGSISYEHEGLNYWDDPELPEQRPDQSYHPPEWFDFPCSAPWRCGYSGEPYYPDAEEVRRAERLEKDMALNERCHNEADPFKAALRAAH